MFIVNELYFKHYTWLIEIEVMKARFKTICFFFVVIFISFNGKIVQSQDLKAWNLKEENQISKEINTVDNQKGRKLPFDQLNQLYSASETRIGIFSKMASEPATMKKKYSELIGKDSLTITIYYRKNRIITVVYRIINSMNEKIKNLVFYFDEKNNCISYSKREKKDLSMIITAMFGDSLIRFDANYDKFDLNNSQKQQVIQSTKITLDSIMIHFPDFKYSMNWK